jgi:ATP-dependent helicase/nuclease subunit A
VVFLVDTTSSPSDTQRLRLIHLPRGNGGEVVVWAGKKADDPEAVAKAREAMLSETENEYRRLLYVAMTRAADRLVVGGCMPGNRNSVRDDCWYDLIRKGLATSGLVEQRVETPHGPVARFVRQLDAEPMAVAPAGAVADGAIALPAWLCAPVATSAAPDLLRPSGAGEVEGRRIRGGESLQSRAAALQRGTLVHRLLQSLPDLAADRRHDAARNFLERNAPAWSEADRDRLAKSVLGLIADRRFAAVFAPGSRAEVSVVGRLERPEGLALVSGQIDRLVVTENEVLIVDFKTNQAPPRAAAEAPPAYVRQLALYRAVLAKLYPQLPVRAALLWTEAPELMEILPAALDAALA